MLWSLRVAWINKCRATRGGLDQRYGLDRFLYYTECKQSLEDLPRPSWYALDARYPITKGWFALTRTIPEWNRCSLARPTLSEGTSAGKTSDFSEQRVANAGLFPWEGVSAPSVATQQKRQNERHPATEQVQGHCEPIQCPAAAATASLAPAPAATTILTEITWYKCAETMIFY